MLILTLPELFKAMQNPFSRSRGGDPKQLTEAAFRQGAVTVAKIDTEGNALERAVQKEGVRIKKVGSAVSGELKAICASWPSLHNIPEAYRELAAATVDLNELKKAEGFVNWTATQVKNLQMTALKRVSFCRSTIEAREVRQHFYGRTTAYVKRARAELLLLTEISKKLRILPNFEQVPTIVIAGLPNVGKSSLLGAITGSRPTIAPWPFTTKGIMMGHMEFAWQRVQFVDTPGLLDRPIEKRNRIEMNAIAILKSMANLVVYVFDTSETCGYSLEQQMSQYEQVKELFKKPVIPVANKVDIVGGRSPEEIKIPIFQVSSETGAGIDALKKFIGEQLKKLKK